MKKKSKGNPSLNFLVGRKPLLLQSASLPLKLAAANERARPVRPLRSKRSTRDELRLADMEARPVAGGVRTPPLVGESMELETTWPRGAEREEEGKSVSGGSFQP